MIKNNLFTGDFWKKHALEDLLPLWYEKVIDREYGGYYSNLSREWKPIKPWEKIPAMISRQVFSFSSAYLLSGDEKYLEAAREGVNFLLAHCWDQEYGGWYSSVSRDGQPLDSTKKTNTQLYANVGLAQYYFATGDRDTLSYVYKSLDVFKNQRHDRDFEGYYETLLRDLSVKDSAKNKHAHYGYVGSLLLNLWLFTKDPDVLVLSKQLTDLSIERMFDKKAGWIRGYVNPLDRNWKPATRKEGDKVITHIGAQLTAALSFLRLYHQTGDKRYLEQGERLGELINEAVFKDGEVVWAEMVENEPPYTPIPQATIMWWVQIYGSFLQLQLYRLTGKKEFLEKFEICEKYYEKYFIDKDYGGVFEVLNLDGGQLSKGRGQNPWDGAFLGEGRKANPWHTSYHEIEHCMLNMLYLDLYVDNKPVVLHFKLDGSQENTRHYVSPVDDTSIHIQSVTIDDQEWNNFNSAECYITLPNRKDLKVEITLGSASTPAPANSCIAGS